MFSAIQCEFETDFCGFEVTGMEKFNFTIEKAGYTDQVPASDHNGNKEGHFAYVFAGEDTPELAQTELETYMVHGENHRIECLSFWVAMKV